VKEKVQHEGNAPDEENPVQMRKTLSILASSLVVLVAVLYVVAPTKEVLSVAVAEKVMAKGGPTPRTSKPGAGHGFQATAVVYGSARGPNGAAPVAGWVSLDAVLPHAGGAPLKIDLSPAGTFRTVVRAPGTYAIVVWAEFIRRWYQAGKLVSIGPGRAYDISAVLRFESVFTMLPVTSY
jgi:hypothetical protein